MAFELKLEMHTGIADLFLVQFPRNEYPSDQPDSLDWITIGSRMQYGNTPLAMAAIYGHASVCSLLLYNGADKKSINKVGISNILDSRGSVDCFGVGCPYPSII